MTTDPSFIDYVIDQSGFARRLRPIRLFGEYGLYLDDVVVAFVANNSLFVKPFDATVHLADGLPQGLPYWWATPCLVADELLEDTERLQQLLLATQEAVRNKKRPQRRPTKRPNHSNIVLIGMPGAGKSTIGVLLAKQTTRDFVDTDLLIQSTAGRSLQDIVDHDGYEALRRLEEEVLLELSVTNHVIATGGSAVYSERAMRHLKAEGLTIYLDVDLPTLLTRINDFSTRGLAKRPDQDLADLMKERSALYQHYADLTIDCTGLTQEQVCERIVTATGTPGKAAAAVTTKE